MGDGEKPGKIVLHQDQHAPETPFQQAAQNRLPVFEIFPASPRHTGEDLLTSIAAQADDDVDAGGTQTIAVAKLDVLAIEKQGQQVAIEGPAIAQLQLLDQSRRHAVQILLHMDIHRVSEPCAAPKTRRRQGQAEQFLCAWTIAVGPAREGRAEVEAAALASPKLAESSKLTQFITHFHGYGE